MNTPFPRCSKPPLHSALEPTTPGIRPKVAALLVLMFIAAALSGAHAQNIPDAAVDNVPPNIVIFVADDAGWRDFGAYGNTSIRTPSIDRLAEGGLLFERAFLTVAQCSPSRISMLTGKYPHATGAEDLHMPLPPDEVIVPSYLQQAGYFTGHMRKTHYGLHAERQFQWYSQDVGDLPEFLDESGERPFFLWVGFNDPHRPYQENTVDPPHDPETVNVPPYLADTPETRADLARYSDEISRMDAEIGIALEELERRGLRENTLVIFLSDNGMPFPGAKGTVYDEGTKTPLIFSWPARMQGGSRYDGLTSVIDLAPTLLDLAGVDRVEDMQGESILPILFDSSLPGRSYVFAERNWHDCDEHIRSVRNDRFKLIRNAYIELPFGTPADASSSPTWYSLLRMKDEGNLTPAQARIFTAPRPRIELYDVENDPWELTNLAGKAEYADLAAELAKVLDDWMTETGDFGPWTRRRDDHTDRITGVRFGYTVPPMYGVDVDVIDN